MNPQEKPINPEPNPESTINPKAVAFLAFFPLTGALGIHDFVIRKPIPGIIHALITVLSPYVLMFLPMLFISTDAVATVNAITSVILYVVLLTSYIWAVFEGVKYLKNSKNNNQIVPQSQPVSTDSQVISQSKDHFKTAKKMLKAALIIAGVVSVWFAIVLLPLQGYDNSGGGAGAIVVFLAPAIPFLYAVPILLIIALVQAILGARDKKKTSSQDNQQARP